MGNLKLNLRNYHHAISRQVLKFYKMTFWYSKIQNYYPKAGKSFLGMVSEQGTVGPKKQMVGFNLETIVLSRKF